MIGGICYYILSTKTLKTKHQTVYNPNQKSKLNQTPMYKPKPTLHQTQQKLLNQQKLQHECLRILQQQTVQQNNKWLALNKINSYSLRNDKAGDIVNTVNYIYQKALVGGQLPDRQHPQQQEDNHLLLEYLFMHHKSSSKKIIEFCHLIKHFSLWDYEFEFFYYSFLGRQLEHVGLYLTCRTMVVQSNVNKYKKDVLSGVLAEIEEWSKLAKNIFKAYDEKTVTEEFVAVVKLHYFEVKKNQNQRINGAEFFKICQIMSQRLYQLSMESFDGIRPQKVSKGKQNQTTGQFFRQSLINDLTMQDRQLIRILSCKDKNIARLLEQKHNKVTDFIKKMVNMIGQQVDSLRKDIQIEKRRYLEVIQEKKALLGYIERIKKKALEYVVDNSVRNEEDLLQILEAYNKKYNPHIKDVAKCRREIQSKRLLEVIEAEERMP